MSSCSQVVDLEQEEIEAKMKISSMTKPFAIMKVGIKGYGGEAKLWNLPKGCRPTVCHILVRVREELTRARKEALDVYPFGLTTTSVSVLKKLDMNLKSIDIFLVPVKAEISDWAWGFPNPGLINWNSERRGFKRLIYGGEERKIPNSVRLWLRDEKYEKKGKRYPVLLIDDISLYEKDELTLDFQNAPCRNFSTNKPVEGFLSGRGTFGVFENRDEEPKGEGKRKVIAKGKLISPYLGHAKK